MKVELSEDDLAALSYLSGHAQGLGESDANPLMVTYGKRLWALVVQAREVEAASKKSWAAPNLEPTPDFPEDYEVN